MEKLIFDLTKYQQPTKSCTYEWQDRVLKVLEYLDCPPNKKSCIFKAFRTNRSKAEAIIKYMEERRINNVFYFLKLWTSKNL